MDARSLLQTAFATAIRFRESSGTSAPRPLLVMEALPDDKLLVLEQGLFAVELRELTVEQLLGRAWPDLTRTYAEAADQMDRTARSWLPCGVEQRKVLDLALQKGKSMATKKATKKAATLTAKVEPAKPTGYPGVFVDYSRRTCIALKRASGRVEAILMADGAPFDVESWNEEMFDRRFDKRLDDYPVDRAAQLFVSFATTTGATEAALEALGRFVNISEKEVKMATEKKAANAAAKTAAPAKKTKAATSADAALAKKVAAKTAAPAEKKAKAESAPRETAAAMFQDLLRQGKLTDDQIFAKVQAKFGLDDKKRSYVGWYRNYMRKQGETVADPLK